MNFLAHAYLSFNHKEVLAGNMVSDFVKGKARFQYSPGIQKGIALHRAIDAYTDAHEATKSAMQVFRPVYRLYSGPIMDVLYDHFLAADATIFTDTTLLQFSQNVYATLEAQTAHLPLNFTRLLPYMKEENWLYRYRTREGIEKSLRGLVRRAAYLQESNTAMALFHTHYPFLNECYSAFIQDVKNFAKNEFDKLIA